MTDNNISLCVISKSDSITIVFEQMTPARALCNYFYRNKNDKDKDNDNTNDNNLIISTILQALTDDDLNEKQINLFYDGSWKEVFSNSTNEYPELKRFYDVYNGLRSNKDRTNLLNRMLERKKELLPKLLHHRDLINIGEALQPNSIVIDYEDYEHHSIPIEMMTFERALCNYFFNDIDDNVLINTKLNNYIKNGNEVEIQYDMWKAIFINNTYPECEYWTNIYNGKRDDVRTRLVERMRCRLNKLRKIITAKSSEELIMIDFRKHRDLILNEMTILNEMLSEDNKIVIINNGTDADVNELVILIVMMSTAQRTYGSIEGLNRNDVIIRLQEWLRVQNENGRK